MDNDLELKRYKLDDFSPMLIDKSKMLDVRESHFIWQVNKFVERNFKFRSETMRDKSIQIL